MPRNPEVSHLEVEVEAGDKEVEKSTLRSKIRKATGYAGALIITGMVGIGALQIKEASDTDDGLQDTKALYEFMGEDAQSNRQNIEGILGGRENMRQEWEAVGGLKENEAEGMAVVAKMSTEELLAAANDPQIEIPPTDPDQSISDAREFLEGSHAAAFIAGVALTGGTAVALRRRG